MTSFKKSYFLLTHPKKTFFSSWHMVWGEDPDPPLRQDDKNLPTAFRLKFGTEHYKNDWNDVTLSPNVPKKIVTKQEFNHETGQLEYLVGGPGSEIRGDGANRTRIDPETGEMVEINSM